MLPKLVRIFGVSLIFLLLLTSCGLLPGATAQQTQDPAVFFTQAAETVSVEMTINALGSIEENPTETPLPPATSTPLPLPTEEAPVIEEPTVELATSTLMPTLEPETPMLHVTENTNCRAGPSRVYRVEGYVTTDMVLPVRGINEGRSWWWVDNPTYPDYHCWVSKWTSEVEGDTSLVPVYRDPWTPTPGVGHLTAEIYDWTDYVEGKCPLEVSFTAVLTSDKAQTVGYRWLKKNGVIGAKGWITIPADGSRVISYSYSPVGSTESYIRLQITSPFNEIVDKAKFTVKCKNK